MAEAARVLIIDDDNGFARLVQRHLERASFEVVHAENATTGREMLNNGPLDAVILDHILPEHDGLTLLTELRGKPGSPPVVYLTGSQESSVAVAALKAGAADYVVKDTQGEFLVLLETAVENAIRGEALRRAKDTAEAEVRAARDRFKALAEERALLLREVNHRVSNSLQLIASLLHFQGDASQSLDVKAALKEANSRVLAVARVHRSLYTSFDVKWVSLGDYVSALVKDLEDVSAGGKDSISVETQPIQVDPDTAVSVGIIATELILNVFKHAYPNGEGPVRVQLLHNSGTVSLIVQDEGVGAGEQAGVPADKKTGLGQRIIAGMAEKVDGKISFVSSGDGTTATLSFPATFPDEL